MSTCIRRLLPGLLSLLVAVAAAAVERTPTPYGTVSLPFILHKVPDAPVYYVIGHSGVPDAENEGHTSNAGFVVTSTGVVVFDALGTPALGYRLLQRIREVTDQPVERIVISHYHADHIYGLQASRNTQGIRRYGRSAWRSVTRGEHRQSGRGRHATAGPAAGGPVSLGG